MKEEYMYVPVPDPYWNPPSIYKPPDGYYTGEIECTNCKNMNYIHIRKGIRVDYIRAMG